MTRPRVYVTRRLPGGALDFLAERANVTVWQGELPPPRDELLSAAASSHAILTLLTDRIDEELLEQAPGLLVISNMATGFDNVDVNAATRLNILVTRTPGVLAGTTADFAFALLLAAARRLAEGDRATRRGEWKTWGPEIMLGYDVHGATLGIIGMGGIGREMAARARGFHMRVLYYSRTRKPDLERHYQMDFSELDTLLRESDFVSLHAPLSEETRAMIGARELRMMKPTAVLVNTARGPLVDERALYEALRDRVIAAAALDVTDPEPVAPDNPLLTLENVIITPHIASASVATRSRMAMLAAENLVRALRGEIPEHAVNPEIEAMWRKRLEEGKRLTVSDP
jgi:glyoxylate reductase